MIKYQTYKIKESIIPPISLLLIGGIEEVLEYTNNILKDLTITDFDKIIIRSEESEGKNDIISIKQIIHSQRFINLTPIGEYKALIVENASKMNKEAANSLLKTLEEPPKYAIIILHSESDNLLPTITSRCRKINLLSKEDKIAKIDVMGLLDTPFYNQSRVIGKIVDEGKSLEFLMSFEIQLRNKLLIDRNLKEAKFIKEIVETKRDLKRNVNAKLALESLILRYANYV